MSDPRADYIATLINRRDDIGRYGRTWSGGGEDTLPHVEALLAEQLRLHHEEQIALRRAPRPAEPLAWQVIE